ncbi:MAG: GWxTD domain-containing protein [Acidobacteria bacterium]|nr:GWxTD domain-containing protein [Acidobacteriota bacterium]
MPDQMRVPPRFSLFVAGVATIAILAFALPVLGQDDLSRGDRRWLEEVEPIMTAQERQAFESLPRNQRNRFKEHFWARRSQNPHDPDRAEDQFNNWREQADDQFGARGRTGSRTDMALVMLLFGPPDNRERTGGRAAGPGGARPPAGATGENPVAGGGGAPGAGGGGGRGGGGMGGGPGSGMKFSYVPNPDRGLPDGLELEFRNTNLGMRLIRNDEIEAAIARARARQILWPSQINFTLNADGELPDVEDLFGAETRALLDPNSPGKTILNALRAGGEPGAGIAMDAAFSFFRSNAGDTYVAALFELDTDSITWNGDNATVSVFYNVVDALGTVIGYDERTVELQKGPAGGPTVLEMPMQMAPGAYSVYAGVLDPTTQTHGTITREIESPNFGSGEFMLSSVARFSDGSRVEDFTPEPGRALLVGGFHFVPKVSTVYAPGDALRLVFNAYGYDASGEPSLSWQITFRKDGEQFLRYNPTAFNLASAELSIAIVDVPLARLFQDGRREPFEAGDYIAEITVRDAGSGKSVTETVEFQVSGS